jgi:hypothetical protein
MRLDSQDLNGFVPLIKNEVLKHFDIKIQTIKLMISHHQVFFDGEVIYKGIKFKVYGSVKLSYNEPYFILSFSDSHIQNQFIKLNLAGFFGQFIKADSKIKMEGNQLYLAIDLLPFSLNIINFEMKENEILTNFILS